MRVSLYERKFMDACNSHVHNTHAHTHTLATMLGKALEGSLAIASIFPSSCAAKLTAPPSSGAAPTAGAAD